MDSHRAFLNAYIQSHADTNQVSSNIRFNFLHYPLVERAFIVKVTNLFNF